MFAARHRSLTLLLSLAIPTSGCHSWQVQAVTPAELLTAASPPGEVRLRLLDSTQVVLREPRLAGDSVAGTVKGAPTAVPVVSVADVAVRRFSAGRTVGLVGAGFATLFAVAAVACATEGCGPSFGSMSLGE
jgi:hypothetical protein